MIWFELIWFYSARFRNSTYFWASPVKFLNAFLVFSKMLLQTNVIAFVQNTKWINTYKFGYPKKLKLSTNNNWLQLIIDSKIKLLVWIWILENIFIVFLLSYYDSLIKRCVQPLRILCYHKKEFTGALLVWNMANNVKGGQMWLFK